MPTFYKNTEFLESIVRVNDDETITGIPCDPANIDYQQYLAWVDAGNTPEPWNPEQENN